MPTDRGGFDVERHTLAGWCRKCNSATYTPCIVLTDRFENEAHILAATIGADRKHEPHIREALREAYAAGVEASAKVAEKLTAFQTCFACSADLARGLEPRCEDCPDGEDERALLPDVHATIAEIRALIGEAK